TSNAGRIDYYLSRDGVWEHSITGDRIPVHIQSANVARVHAVAFTLAAGEQTRILARIESKRPLHIAPRLYSSHTFETSQQRAALWDGLLFGGLLVLAWGATIIAILAPSPHFAVMALLCAAVALYEATVRGYTKVYLWPHSIERAERSPGGTGLGSLALLLIFVLGISRSQRIRLPCRKALIALMTIIAALTVTAALGYTSLVAQLVFPVLIVYGVTLFIAAALLVR